MIQSKVFNLHFKDKDNTLFHSIDRLVVPIKSFISEYIIQMMVGIPTVILGSILDILKNDPGDYMMLSLPEQYNFLSSQKLVTGQISESYLNLFSQFLINYDGVWSSLDLTRFFFY